MKIKEGDKLICHKPKKSFFRSDPEPFFTDGKIYEVDKLSIGNPNGTTPIETLVIYQDNHHPGWVRYSGRGIRFLNNDEINPDTSFGKIFISIKELRKRKLKKLNETSNLH